MIEINDKPRISWALNKRIVLRENVIPVKVCNDIIEEYSSKVAKGINKYPTFDTSFHTCLLPKDHEVHNYLKPVWEELSNYYQFNIDLVEPYELKKYEDGDFFGSHVDNYYSLANDIERKLTISIQLSDVNDHSGGMLKLFNNLYKANQGGLVAFPTFFPHEVTPIIRGTRWTLIGWAWGPYWR